MVRQGVPIRPPAPSPEHEGPAHCPFPGARVIPPPWQQRPGAGDHPEPRTHCTAPARKPPTKAMPSPLSARQQASPISFKQAQTPRLPRPQSPAARRCRLPTRSPRAAPGSSIASAGPRRALHLGLQALDLDLPVLDLLAELLGNCLLRFHDLQEVEVLLHQRLVLRRQVPVAAGRQAVSALLPGPAALRRVSRMRRVQAAVCRGSPPAALAPRLGVPAG